MTWRKVTSGIVACSSKTDGSSKPFTGAQGRGPDEPRPGTSPYLCPRHIVSLVARVLVIDRKRTGNARLDSGPGSFYRRNVRYFACPVAGCDFKKPDKWKNRKRYGKNS